VNRAFHSFIPRSRTIPNAFATDVAQQTCLNPDCAARFAVDEVLTACRQCGGLLDVTYDWDRVSVPSSLREFEVRWGTRAEPLDFSGVWRFRELLPFAAEGAVVTIGEGQTILQGNDGIARFAGMDAGCVFLQYEGLNPSGSFKDNGMTAAATHARMVGAKQAACASTGNTSASLAVYASAAGAFQAIVFVGSGKIAYGKLSQALDFGALTIQIQGDFDDALVLVREVCAAEGIYLCNSVNPFRLEGQKAIIYRILEGLDWEPPDWIVVPGGNLGNSSAFGKALAELKQLGLIDRIPRLAVINAAGANTLYRVHEEQQIRWNAGRPDYTAIGRFYQSMNDDNRRAHTLATAIQINRPVNLVKCLRALEVCDGVVRQVSDEEILDAKAQVGAHGFGCEPASGASVAGLKLLREQGVIAASDRVACVLTGHQLKDPNATVAYHSSRGTDVDSYLKEYGVRSVQNANGPVSVANDFEQTVAILREFRRQSAAPV
jgi:threonine synthase